jgi:hypothetical protein
VTTVGVTSTFFINGSRHYGSYDIGALTAAVQTPKARAMQGKPQPPAASRRAS